MSKIREYTVTGSRMSTPSTLVVDLQDTVKRLPLSYEPGQYAAISFLHNSRPTPARCFSIASSPTEQGYLQFALRIGGDFTHAAARDLVVGSKVIVEGPFGSFAFNTERDKSALLLAGGIGITPFMSMLRYTTRLQLANNLMLVLSCKTQDEIPYFDELIYLMNRNPNITVVFVIGSGPIDKLQGRYVMPGRVDKKFLDQITSKYYAGRTYFVCGPSPFMKAVSSALIENGAPADSVLTEAFSQGQQSLRTFRHNLPLQVYALTGLGIILGSGAFLVHDAVADTATSPAGSVGAITQSDGITGNSRQGALNQVIGNLQSGNSITGSTGTTTTTGSGAAGSGTGGSSPTSSSPSGGGSTSSGGSSSTGTGGTTGTTGGTGTGSGSGGSTGGSTTTPTPVAPSLSFGASSTSITAGQSTVLSWSINSSATAPVTCSASGSWSGSKPTSGSQTVAPSSTATYSLACSNSAGSSSKSVTISVQPACVSTPSNPC